MAKGQCSPEFASARTNLPNKVRLHYGTQKALLCWLKRLAKAMPEPWSQRNHGAKDGTSAKTTPVGFNEATETPRPHLEAAAEQSVQPVAITEV